MRNKVGNNKSFHGVLKEASSRTEELREPVGQTLLPERN